MDQPYGTYLSVNLNALVHNYNFIKSQLQKPTQVLAVIKAFAYGHESVGIAKKLEQEGIAYFAVAYVAEGITLRKAGIKTPILVLHPQIIDVEACLQYQLEPNIYSFKLLEIFQSQLKAKGEKLFKIHLKFNTGLNRLGFKRTDISHLMAQIKQDDTLKIQSVFSHLVASEDHDLRDFTLGQIAQYKDIVTAIQQEISYSFIRHLANTSGTLNYPEAHFDMVRTGIGLYGYGNEDKWTEQLQNVGSLFSVITQIHTIQVGESVGYNRGFVAENKVRTATIPLGHADGIPRTWGKGKGFITINGKKAKLLGNVCMDMIMVDVTDISCEEGDAVQVFDNQKTVEEIAENVGTISYELLTAISQRVPRILQNE
ncbi:MAG: alanine racemase [Flavobacteriaceae bacterium]|nr:alanine racemase [Flavobacteriaceae bacterium]